MKREIVFMPYKASMWDSLESIWIAANEDPDCEAYVVPIPYYDKKPDGKLGAYHYEGEDFPEDVPIVDYREYDLAKRKPYAIYIHNPYDYASYVTTIALEYYSDKLKKYTENLVYVPYYSTAGGMSEAQSLCPGYMNADYIVVQGERYRKFFDSKLPDKKFLPLGSPKFDRVLRLCKNPPKAPVEWETRLAAGRKVYFYNTSLGGMLADTGDFLIKMQYVFNTFKGREDSLVIWRPHPLMESTFDSLRAAYKPIYEKLKRYFLQENIGILDETPDIEKTIALCDAYIGDSGTSVTSLFGMAGKPLFILNNYINSEPAPQDWRGGIISGYFPDGDDEWVITQGNKLYNAPDHDYNYKFYCDLSGYASGGYYIKAVSVGDKVFVCPANAQDVLVVSEHRIIKKINLKKVTEKSGAFVNAVRIGKYIFLIPFKYPAIVRVNTENFALDYVEGCNNIFVSQINGESRIGGFCAWKNYLLLASPVNNNVVAIEAERLVAEMLKAGSVMGCMTMLSDGDGVCMLPFKGTNVSYWNPDKGEVYDYTDQVPGFECLNKKTNTKGLDCPFGNPAVFDGNIILPPLFGNKFIHIDMYTGVKSEWTPPFAYKTEGRNGYFASFGAGNFIRRTDTLGEGTFRFYYTPERRLFDINFFTGEYKEILIQYDEAELRENNAGFAENSQWLKYACEENAFCSLRDFLDSAHDSDNGGWLNFDKKRQLGAFSEDNANCDGSCGSKVHHFITHKHTCVQNGVKKYKTKIYGHRGASEYAPENTMEAFKLAYEMGADGIELDVQMTKDGYLVVAHDETINRVSDGQGYIKDMTLTELRTYNFNRTHPEYSFCQIPLLEDILEYFKDKDFLYNFELKNSVVDYAGLEEKTLELVKSYGALDKTIFSSFNHSSMCKLRGLEHGAKVAFLTAEVQSDVVKYLKDAGVEIYHPAWYLLDRSDMVKDDFAAADTVDSLRQNGITVNAWTVNAGSMIRRLFNSGIDGIITNKPDLANTIRNDP